MASSNEYDRFLMTYRGRRLLEQHTLTETGLWQIRGEDPNCELHGPHSEPELGYRQGMLRDVIEEAVEMSGFWQWGGGGSIHKISVAQSSTDNTKRRKELITQRNKLQADIEAIDKELGE